MEKRALGADLVIPVLALAFAAYFFVSISGLAWEAKANGVIIGTALTVLALAQVARIALAVFRGRATLATDPLWQPREVLGKRIAMVLVTIAFIATIPWLGLTLGLLIGMAGALWLMGVRRPRLVAAISFTVALAAYGLFILALDARFPHGPVEKGIAAMRGKQA